MDDSYLGPQNKAGAFYSRGRHTNCKTLYITENYFTLLRNSVRENSNFIIFYPQNSKSVQDIQADYCPDLPFEEFSALCQRIWKANFNFLTIDLSSEILDGKCRKNLEKLYLPKAYI